MRLLRRLLLLRLRRLLLRLRLLLLPLPLLLLPLDVKATGTAAGTVILAFASTAAPTPRVRSHSCDVLLQKVDVGQEELVLALIGTSVEEVQVTPRHHACALEVLALDSMDAFEALLTAEAKAAKEDPVRTSALQALSTPDWLEAVREFVADHQREFQAGGGSQLVWTQRHEEYQEACEALLEDLLTAANVDPTAVLQQLCTPTKDPPGVTPLPALAWLPLRAFVDYKSFETMMTGGL